MFNDLGGKDRVPSYDDGDQLIEMLKELELGMKKRLVEEIEVDLVWFGSI